MPKVLKEDGTWRDGRAAPELLREELRKLPSELVTKDDQSVDQVHALDPPHIVAALADEHAKKLTGAAKEFKDPEGEGGRLLPGGPLAAVGERKKLSQREVDWVRLRVMSVLLGNILRAAKNGFDPDFRVRHLWFPEDEVNIYELREGKPPSDIDRPKHMRGLNIWIDPKHVDNSMAGLAREVGVEIGYDITQDRRKMAEQRD